MLNYEVDPAIVEPLVPRGTELDFFQGKTYLSVVGFMFLNTRVLGWPIPFHRNFEEVNLRFYVRREVDGEVRRGVVFIKELVPRWAIATVARAVYNEPYVSAPMRHSINGFKDADATCTADYEWRIGGMWNGISIECERAAALAAPSSHDEFITEHYWGYCPQRDGSTIEYRVDHPPWLVHGALQARLDCDVGAVCGSQFTAVLTPKPASAFLADGSQVAVRKPSRLLAV
jgi:hypothetical protein